MTTAAHKAAWLKANLKKGEIYAGKGRGRDGLRDYHLILATDPASVFTKRMVGTYGIDVEGATSDHNGPANTLALADAGSELCKEILALEIDGHKDFYLMSRTDGQLCWANVPEQFEKEWYLTSTQYSSDVAWGQDFGYGHTSNTSKKYEGRARACRRYWVRSLRDQCAEAGPVQAVGRVGAV